MFGGMIRLNSNERGDLRQHDMCPNQYLINGTHVLVLKSNKGRQGNTYVQVQSDMRRHVHGMAKQPDLAGQPKNIHKTMSL